MKNISFLLCILYMFLQNVYAQTDTIPIVSKNKYSIKLYAYSYADSGNMVFSDSSVLSIYEDKRIIVRKIYNAHDSGKVTKHDIKHLNIKGLDSLILLIDRDGQAEEVLYQYNKFGQVVEETKYKTYNGIWEFYRRLRFSYRKKRIKGKLFYVQKNITYKDSTLIPYNNKKWDFRNLPINDKYGCTIKENTNNNIKNLDELINISKTKIELTKTIRIGKERTCHSTGYYYFSTKDCMAFIIGHSGYNIVIKFITSENAPSLDKFYQSIQHLFPF